MIYIIKRLSLDPTENRNPLYEQIEGYCETGTEAVLVCSRLIEAHPPRDRYGDQMYPQFFTVRVKRIS